MASVYKFAVSCSSNMNRSMEAHSMLFKRGFNVRSFGTGDKVKLPGPGPDKPNCYEFGTSYEFIYNDLLEKDKSLYTQNGLLHMLDRNKRLKRQPERFQECDEKFDIVFTCEEKVYDQVLECEFKYFLIHIFLHILLFLSTVQYPLLYFLSYLFYR